LQIECDPVAVARYTCHVVTSLRIALCGGLTVERDGDSIEGELAGRQGREVFAYLALNRRRPVSRDEVAAMLWPEQAPRAPEAALNTILARLRRVLGHNALGARGQLTLALGGDSWIDVEAAEQGARPPARCWNATTPVAPGRRPHKRWSWSPGRCCPSSRIRGSTNGAVTSATSRPG
jgi:hypothetical protein